jgi:hypothetical protein
MKHRSGKTVPVRVAAALDDVIGNAPARPGEHGSEESGTGVAIPHSPFPAEVDKTTEVRYNFGIFVNNENAKNHS